MSRLCWALAVCAIFITASCAKPGAGVSQYPCGLTDQVKATAPPGGGQAIAQAVEGGQRATNDPRMSDIASWEPGTTWNAGQGNLDSANEWRERRAQSGAPSVNQGLVLPSTANAQQNSGVTSPAVVAIQQVLDDLRLALKCCEYKEEKADILTAIDLYTDKLARAVSDDRKMVETHYHFDNSLIQQSVANSSVADGKPSGTEAGDDGSSTTPSRVMVPPEFPAPLTTSGDRPQPVPPSPAPSGAAVAPESLPSPPVEEPIEDLANDPWMRWAPKGDER